MKPKPKTQQQMEELIELMRGEMAKLKPNCCYTCESAIALYQCSIDTMIWAIGKSPKKFSQMVRDLKRKHAEQTKHHRAIVE